MSASEPTLAEVRAAVRALADPARAAAVRRYFKTGPGQYAEGDRFLGLTMPQQRALARRFRGLPLEEAEALLRSPWHEERMLALLLLVDQHRRGDQSERRRVFRLYLANLRHIDNWDLIDTSAEHIVGPHATPALLDRLARSRAVWHRRVAVLATFHHIRRGAFGPALRVARLLREDEHDLIHKAVGWMLREVHRRDPGAAERFLLQHRAELPRTTLRYAIERMPPARRRAFLTGEGLRPGR